MIGRFLNCNPILLLAIPFVLGIATVFICGMPLQIALMLFAFGVLFMLAGFPEKLARRFFGIGAIVTMFSLGAFVEYLDEKEMQPRWSGEKGCFEAVLLEVPQMRGASTKVRAEVCRLGRDSVIGARRRGIVNIYFANCVEAEDLRIGEKIFFEGKVKSPVNAGNPAEFDAARYHYVNGVTGLIYLPIDGWRSYGVGDLTLNMRALQLRERICKLYENLGFAGDELALLSALTVGEKRDLSEQLKDIYAAVGASHVLALSGLHLAIFYMIIMFAFPFKGAGRLLFVLRETLIVTLLWDFAAIAGFSPSVVRAALLFTLMSFARCLRRDVSSINSLALAAILMLLYSPRYLFDVSFQLSFSAVFAILLLVPVIRRFVRADDFGIVYRFLADTFAVSIAAQIGVFPFIWYYFGTFPICFLFTNLIVVPGAFFIMWLSVIMILFTPFSFVQLQLARLLDVVLSAQNTLLYKLAELPYASLKLPYIGPVEALVAGVLVLFLIFAVVCSEYRKFCIVALIASVVAVWHWGLASPKKECPYIIFYNSRSCPAAQLVYSFACSYMLSSYPQVECDFTYIAERFWLREGMAHPKWLSDGYSDSLVSCKDGVVRFADRTLKIIADDCWLGQTDIIPVDCIYLCRGFLGTMNELLLRYPTRCIVMDATLYSRSRTRIARECAEMGVRCIDLSSEGAMKFHCTQVGINMECMRGK